MICKKKIIVLSNKSDLDIFSELKRTNENFFTKYINPTPSKINGVSSTVLDKLVGALKRSKYEVVGSYGDLSLIIEKNGQYFIILLFVNPDLSHFNILSDYRDYYQASIDNGVNTYVVWLEDLYEDFDLTKKNLLDRLNSVQNLNA